MTAQTEHASVKRVRTELESHGVATEIRHLADTARTAVDAANVLEVEVGQIASSIVFKIDTDQGERPLLVVTSGRHRVDTAIVASALGVPKLGRADADFVRLWSGFAIGGVSPSDGSMMVKSFNPEQLLTPLLVTTQWFGVLADIPM